MQKHRSLIIYHLLYPLPHPLLHPPLHPRQADALRAPHWLIATIIVSTLIVSTLLMSAANAQASDDTNHTNTAMPPWSMLEYSASKFFIRMDSSVQLEHLSPELTQKELLPLPTALAPSTSAASKPVESRAVELKSADSDTGTIKIVLKSSMLDRHTQSTVWLRPDFSALQRESWRYGKHYRYQLYRFLDDGAYSITRRPEKDRETNLHWSEWSRQSSKRYQLASSLPQGVTEAEVLFLLAMDQQLYTPGQNKVLLLFDKDRIVTVNVDAQQYIRLPVQFDLYNGTDHQKINEDMPTIRASLATSGSGGDELDILGFVGRITLYIEPKRQMIVRISGNMEVIGEVNINLKKVYLADTRQKQK